MDYSYFFISWTYYVLKTIKMDENKTFVYSFLELLILCIARTSHNYNWKHILTLPSSHDIDNSYNILNIGASMYVIWVIQNHPSLTPSVSLFLSLSISLPRSLAHSLFERDLFTCQVTSQPRDGCFEFDDVINAAEHCGKVIVASDDKRRVCMLIVSCDIQTGFSIASRVHCDFICR
jgi:hypothetical protein